MGSKRKRTDKVNKKIFEFLEDAVYEENKSTFVPRKSNEQVIASRDPNFVIVTYFVNQEKIEHPLPKSKLKEVEKNLYLQGQVTVKELMTMLNFRKEDQAPLVEHLKQAGHTLNGSTFHFKKLKKSA